MNSKLLFGACGFFVICVAISFLFAVPGCGSSHPSTDTGTSTGTVTVPVAPPASGLTPDQKANILQAINTVGADAVDLGLTEWSHSNNALATTVAQNLHANITNLMPLLNGQNVQPSVVIQGLVASGLYQNIPPMVKIAIEGGSLLLDKFFSIPAAQESDRVDFIRAFITAVDNGCQEYLATPPAVGKSMRKKQVQHGLVELDK